jgi:hypothetical protein
MDAMLDCVRCKESKPEDRVIRFIRPNPYEPEEYRPFAGRCGDCGEVAIVEVKA